MYRGNEEIPTNKAAGRTNDNMIVTNYSIGSEQDTQIDSSEIGSKEMISECCKSVATEK